MGQCGDGSSFVHPRETAELRVVTAERDDLGRYVDLLGELADWLESRGIKQWPRGRVNLSSMYFAGSITRQEVQLAFIGDELVGTLRLLMSDPIVWPEFKHADAVYVYNLGVRRTWAGQDLGGRLLDWAECRAASLKRLFVRLDCQHDNAFLRGYYERKGFIPRGEVDADYPHPVGRERLCRFEKAVHT